MDGTERAAAVAVESSGPLAAGTTTFSVSVRDGVGAPVLGNVFITVTSMSDGRAHRELRYDPRGQRYVFPRLGPGEYGCAVTGAGFEPHLRTVRLDGVPLHVDVTLRPRAQEKGLVIPIGDEWRGAEAIASALWTHATLPLPDDVSLETSLLVALLRDRPLLETLSAPIDAIDAPADLLPYVHAQISASWTFLVGPKAAAGLVRQVAESRVRLYVTTRCVFRNEAVREVAGGLAEGDLHAAAIDLVRALDSTELLEILPILMRMDHPERIPVAHFVQAAADLFGAHLPPRVARRRDSLDAVPSVPGLDGQASPVAPGCAGSTLDDAATAHSPRVAAIARAAAWAIRRSQGAR
jgi:hypothetical protein